MIKPLEETAAERRDYVNQIRESFYSGQGEASERGTRSKLSSSEGREEEGEVGISSLGIRTVIAIVIFVIFVYCDKEQITFHDYKTQDLYTQIEWNPLPIQELAHMLEESK